MFHRNVLAILVFFIFFIGSASSTTVAVVSDASPNRAGTASLLLDFNQIQNQKPEVLSAVVFNGDMDLLSESLMVYDSSTSKDIPVLHVPGNHNMHNKEDVTYLRNAIFNYSFSPKHDYSIDEHMTYSVNIGNMHIIVLNDYTDNTLNNNCDWYVPTGGYDSDDSCFKYTTGDGGYITPFMFSWIESDILYVNRIEQPFIIIFSHEPLFSTQLTNIIKKHNVAAFVNGHDHSSKLYQRDGIIYGDSGAIGNIVSTPTILYLSSNKTNFKLTRVVNNKGGWEHPYIHNISVSLIPSDPPLSPNLIKNPSFESGKDFWVFFTNGKAAFDIASETARIKINLLGTNTQLYQSGIALKSGKEYELSFSGYSNRDHYITLKIIQHTTPYTTYVKYPIKISTTMQDYTMRFTSPGTTSNARIVFWLSGTATIGDINYFDNVTLKEVI